MRMPVAALLLLLAGASACARTAPSPPPRAPAPPTANAPIPEEPDAPAAPPSPASPADPLIASARARLAAATASPTRDRAQLEMARSIAEHAVAADPAYAAAHLALGLVDRELADYPRALASFDRARALGPTLFEAHAAAAALRLRMRDFPAAAAAYRDAIHVRPGDYEARLGLSVALRGALDGGDEAGWEARFQAAQEAIDNAIALDPDRPEAYLSAAALAMDQGIRRPQPEGEQALLRAKIALAKFLSLTSDSPALARQRAIAEARMKSIVDLTECDFHTPESVRKEREMELKRQEAIDETKADWP
jgi:tetratricopeptide (TPR) repeat protein